MKTAAIYCRVSTEDQEREGSSLDSQLSACVKKAQELGYTADSEYVVNEVYSGLILDRPCLNQLRQWVRNRTVDAVVVYSTDRLSRDPVHLLLLAEEFDKAKIALVFVTEPMDNSMEGQLLSFVRGWASKLEAVKIRERTMRGRMERAKAGKLPGGGHARLYGYVYIKGKEQGQGVRIENPDESKWVKEMFRWLVEERLSSEAITRRLRDLMVPTPSGKGHWKSCSVKQILKNPAFCGKTYAFTRTNGEPRFKMKLKTKSEKTGIYWKPKEEWIEIPGATPPIISVESFDAAQEKLKENRKAATYNAKNQYLLRGHVYCARCGRAYWGAGGLRPRNGIARYYPFYRCCGKLKKVTDIKCDNRQHNAKRLEGMVWAEVEKILLQPENVFCELEKRKGQDGVDSCEKDVERVTKQLEHREMQRKRAWKAFEITGDEGTFRADIAVIDREVGELAQEKARLERQIRESQQFNPDITQIKQACELVASNLKSLTFEEKRLALEALRIRVLVDGDAIVMQSAIPVPVGCPVDTVSSFRRATSKSLLMAGLTRRGYALSLAINCLSGIEQ